MTELEKVLEGLGIARENVGFSTKWGTQERDREEIDSAITLLRAQVATIAERDAEIERLKAGLHTIADGEGAYGAQAYEYKNSARKTLGMAPVGGRKQFNRSMSPLSPPQEPEKG